MEKRTKPARLVRSGDVIYNRSGCEDRVHGANGWDTPGTVLITTDSMRNEPYDPDESVEMFWG